MAIQGTKNQIRNIRAVYFMGFGSLLEAIGFTIFYSYSLVNTVNLYRRYFDANLDMPDYMQRAITILAIFLLLYFTRIIISIMAIVGHFFRNRAVLIFFMLWLAVGIVFHMTVGIIGTQTPLTMPIASFVFLSIHILYIIIGWRVLKENDIFKTSENQPSMHPGFHPQTVPAQASVNILPNQPYPAVYNNQNMQHPLMADRVSAPPVYTEYPDNSSNINNGLPQKSENGKF